MIQIMKNLLHCSILTLFITLLLSSCGNSEGNVNSSKDATTDNTEASTDDRGPEYTSAYICPMHCEGSGSDKEGKCPVCKMDYVANKDHEMHHGHDHDGHDHDHDHDHDHN